MKYSDEMRIEKIIEYTDKLLTNWNIICEVLFEDLPKFQEQLHGFENK